MCSIEGVDESSGRLKGTEGEGPESHLGGGRSLLLTSVG